MDETLFYIVIFIVYILFQVLSNSKKKKKRAPLSFPEVPSPDAARKARQPPTGEPTLDDALREIRLALGMGTPPSQPQPPAPEPSSLQKAQPRTLKHPVRTHGPELAETAAAKSWPSEFKPVRTHYADSEFEEHSGEGDRFGKTRPAPLPRRVAKSTPPTKKRKVKAGPSQQATPGMQDPRVLYQLKDPNAARKAFVLSEILGAPRAHRRR